MPMSGPTMMIPVAMRRNSEVVAIVGVCVVIKG